MHRILVVDDDQQIRGWLRHILESKGYQVEEAGDGKEALTYLEPAEPALVVLDIFMPTMDGLEVISHIRSRTQSAKILAISGRMINGHDLTQMALVLGAHGAISKPFNAEVFLQRVAALLTDP